MLLHLDSQRQTCMQPYLHVGKYIGEKEIANNFQKL